MNKKLFYGFILALAVLTSCHKSNPSPAAGQNGTMTFKLDGKQVSETTAAALLPKKIEDTIYSTYVLGFTGLATNNVFVQVVTKDGVLHAHQTYLSNNASDANPAGMSYIDPATQVTYTSADDSGNGSFSITFSTVSSDALIGNFSGTLYGPDGSAHALTDGSFTATYNKN